jgi:hypothetical protein
MTSQTGRNHDNWRRLVIGGVASGAMLAGLVTGVAAPAFAQPNDSTDSETSTAVAEARPPGDNCTGDDCAKPVEGEVTEADAEPAKMSADQALSIIYNEYSQGDGGGQISKLIDDAMNLRAQGFKPSNGNAAALAEALEFRPNQTPLVEALKETIAYQRKLQAQAAMAQQEQGPIAGPVPVHRPDASINAPVGPGGNGGVTIPIG